MLAKFTRLVVVTSVAVLPIAAAPVALSDYSVNKYGDIVCTSSSCSVAQALSRGDIYAATTYANLMRQEFSARQRQSPPQPSRTPSQQPAPGNQSAPSPQPSTDSGPAQGSDDSDAWTQWEKDMAEWERKYGSSSGSSGAGAASGAVSRPTNWAHWPMPVIEVNTPGISELWSRIYTEVTPYPGALADRGKAREYAVLAMARELFDKGSPAGVVSLMEYFMDSSIERAEQWGLRDPRNPYDAAWAVEEEMITFANELAAAPSIHPDDELFPVLKQVLELTGNDPRAAQDYVIYQSTFDGVVKARVINELQRLEAMAAREQRIGVQTPVSTTEDTSASATVKGKRLVVRGTPQTEYVVVAEKGTRVIDSWVLRTNANGLATTKVDKKIRGLDSFRVAPLPT